jgi:uncharacterized membrane protein YfcA
MLSGWLGRAWLIFPGFLLGAYGTLIGAGGGFLLVPLLLLLYPDDSPTTITSVSLAVVFVNAFSGSIAYGRMKRIDYRSGRLFAAATIPGAVLGALMTALLARGVFDVIFGLVMIAIAAFIYARPQEASSTLRLPVTSHRVIVTADGERYEYAFNRWIGLALSLGVGFFSSILGIGGGVIHVPALVRLLGFPPHVATATSHFVLSIMALAGTLVHIISGDFAHGIRRAVALAIGVAVGAQWGARLSNRVHGALLIRLLGLGLGLVGIRLVGAGILAVWRHG